MKKNNKKALSLLLTLALVIGLFAGLTVTASAESLTDPAEDTAIEPETESATEAAIEPEAETIVEPMTAGTWAGSGTATAPYEITDQADLTAIHDGLSSSNTYAGVYFKVMNNITLNSSWAGIGSPTISSYTTSSPYVSGGTGFAGILYSDSNKTITVSRSASTSGVGGLINYLAPGGIVQNLTVAGTVSVSGSCDAVGGVVGYNSGVIDKVTNTVSVTANSAYNVGGIAGFNDGYYMANAQGTIRNSLNNGTVSGYSKVGGVTGENSGLIASCYNTAAISSSNGSKNGVGGIAGRNGNNNTAVETGLIKDCYNTAAISCSNGKWVGGITGFLNSLSSCVNCYDTGNIVAISYKDPISGNTEGTNTNCYYKSGITGVEGYDGAIIKTEAEMKNTSFLTALSGGFTGLWAQTSGSYPYLTLTDTRVCASATGVVGTTPSLETDGIILGGSSADYTDLASAITAASANGKTIYVAGTIALTSGSYGGASNVLIKRSATFNDILFTVNTGEAVSLSNMTIDGNNTKVTGANLIRVYGGSLTMDGTVTLQNSTINANGGAIHVQDGTVTSAATITNCSARNGGGVYLSGGSFTLTGGEISGCSNQAVGKAAGVYVSADTTFALNAASLTLDNEIYLESDAYITVEQAIPCDLTVDSEATASGTVIAQGSGSYTLQEDDVDHIYLSIGERVSLEDNQIVIS